MKSDNSENSAKAKTYNCSECTNSYASISGLRGHLRKKNGFFFFFFFFDSVLRPFQAFSLISRRINR